MTTATRNRIPGRDEAARRHFDLTGDWPIVRGVEWDRERYLDHDDWSSLTEDERTSLEAWMIANDREVRPIRVFGSLCYMHFPVSGVVEISTAPTDRFELSVESESVRHADVVSVVVLNTDSRSEAEAIFLQWLEDVTKHLAARRAAPRLTA